MAIEVDPIYRWNITDPAICGQYYPDQRITDHSSAIEQVLQSSRCFLKSDWQHVDTLLTHRDDIEYTSPTHQRELSFVFENLTSAKMSSRVSLDDLKECLSQPLTAIWNESQWQLPELRSVSDQVLEHTKLPYLTYQVLARFNQYGADSSSSRPYQMGVLIFEFDLIKAEVESNRIRNQLRNREQEVQTLKNLLVELKPITLRTGRL